MLNTEDQVPIFNYLYISNMDDHCNNFWGKTTSNLRYVLCISLYAQLHTHPSIFCQNLYLSYIYFYCIDVLLVYCKRVTVKVWHFTRFLLANWEKLTIGQARSFRYAQCGNWERFRKQILIKPYIHNTPYGRPKFVKKINHTYLIR